MKPGVPRRRPARPVPEAPIEALAGGAEELAKAWLLAMIEPEPLSVVPQIAARDWAAEGPRACAAAVRALGSDEELERLGRTVLPLAQGRALDPLRAVLWSALRSAWPDCEPDQVWDLGERLALVIESLRGAATGAWPGELEQAVATAHGGAEGLAVVLAELVDADRLLAVEDARDCAAVLARFRAAVRQAAGPDRPVVDDGEARAWAIVPAGDRAAALALGTRVAEALAAAPPWRGAPLRAAVGVAVLGEDGEDAAALIEVADEAMLAAAAGGIEIARRPD